MTIVKEVTLKKGFSTVFSLSHGPLLGQRHRFVLASQTLRISSSSATPLPLLSYAAHKPTTALTHGWHPSDVKRVKT